MIVHILRGVSGSGKSTRAKQLAKESAGRPIICSADDYFMKDGEYHFNPKQLRNAHFWCRTRFETALELKVETVIVDNANTRLWEYEKYVDLAKECGYRVFVEHIGNLDDDSLKQYANRNRHDVPLDSIRKQARRFEL